MIEYVKAILRGQFEASLCMLGQCIQTCAPEQWEGKIANATFRQIAYHTLFHVDLYLSPSEQAFEPRDLNRRGNERSITGWRTGLTQDETRTYLTICRQKALETLASETPESLARESGFSWLPFSRGELHVYNIRHVQHHTGQMSAYLRRIDESLKDADSLDWVSTGWRSE